MASLQEIQFLTPYGFINVDVREEGKNLDAGKFQAFIREFLQCFYEGGCEADEILEEFFLRFPKESKVFLNACKRVCDEYGVVILPVNFVDRVLYWLSLEEEEEE